MNQLVNSTVLSNFATVRRLDLLRDPRNSLFIPVEIYHEIQAAQEVGYACYFDFERFLHPFSADGWLQLVTMNEEELLLFTSLPAKLHPGEASCLCIARNRKWGFLTDERAARLQAHDWNIPISGTLGVLTLAVESGSLTLADGNALLQAMITHANYRSPVYDLSLLLLK